MTPPPYGWPLAPFHRAHPVRGYFNDPRISGRSRAFHFGIDIAARNGQAVYAVEEGTAHLEGRRSLSIVCSGGRAFGYWHVVPAVAHRLSVRRHQLLGYVQEPWAHVHFAESRSGVYRNSAPLRRVVAVERLHVAAHRPSRLPAWPRGAPTRPDQRRRRRRLRGLRRAAAPRARPVGRPARDPGAVALARPATEREGRASVANPASISRAAAAGALRRGVRARDAAEQGGEVHAAPPPGAHVDDLGTLSMVNRLEAEAVWMSAATAPARGCRSRS